MSSRCVVLALALTLTVASAEAAHAATAFLFSNNGASESATGPGLATVQTGDSGKFGTASGYEFLGGVGVSAFAHVAGKRGYQNMQVFSSASFTDSFRVSTSTPGLFDAGSGVFILDFRMETSGSASAQNSPIPGVPGIFSSATAAYTYDWQVGQIAGRGSVDDRAFANGTHGREVTGSGADQFGVGTLFVRLGDVVNLRLSASASATADGHADATGVSDFSHTLRWGGLTGVRFQPNDGNGNTIVFPPDAFRLTLVSDTTGFDYVSAAGPNPYTHGAVPEPGAWALMILGFAASGAALRRRRCACAGLGPARCATS